ncbi:MAG: hypothetical protein Q8O37_17095 [Sulfuricellaceae bacterium]|nr:hypothetical protein [Sulfuricellaceae bacterium]
MALIETVSPERVQSNMEIFSHPITGVEPICHESPHAALVRFYHAFNNRDSVAMEENWDHSGRCVMSNPLGGIKRGWDEIGSVYQKIFHGGARVYVEFYDGSFRKSCC